MPKNVNFDLKGLGGKNCEISGIFEWSLCPCFFSNVFDRKRCFGLLKQVQVFNVLGDGFLNTKNAGRTQVK